MDYTYEVKTNDREQSIIVRSDGASIPFEPTNLDYKEYLKSLEA